MLAASNPSYTIKTLLYSINLRHIYIQSAHNGKELLSLNIKIAPSLVITLSEPVFNLYHPYSEEDQQIAIVENSCCPRC